MLKRGEFPAGRVDYKVRDGGVKVLFRVDWCSMHIYK